MQPEDGVLARRRRRLHQRAHIDVDVVVREALDESEIAIPIGAAETDLGHVLHELNLRDSGDDVDVGEWQRGC